MGAFEGVSDFAQAPFEDRARQVHGELPPLDHGGITRFVSFGDGHQGKTH